MAWTSPMTAVANTAFTAAQFNAHVRDNLLETAPGKATTAGRLFVTTGANAIAERAPAAATVFTSETTTSTTYTDLATVGPQVTATTGTRAIVFLTARIANNTNAVESFAAYDVTGATTIAATDGRAATLLVAAANQAARVSISLLETGLTGGSNIFTAKYKVASASTGTFNNRHMHVIPL